MNVTVNGFQREVADRCPLLDLMKQLDLRPGMTVVERNGAILKADQLADTVLAENDVLELVRFVGGG